MPRLTIADLLATSPVDPTAHLDRGRVAALAASREPPPPVVVFDTGAGLLLADGYHRVAAAQVRGEETIDAEVRHGSRRDALEYAAAVGAAERGVSLGEALRRIEARTRHAD